MGPTCRVLVSAGCGGGACGCLSASFVVFFVHFVFWVGLAATLEYRSVSVIPVVPTFCLLAGHSHDQAPWGPVQLMQLGRVVSGWLSVVWVLLAQLTQLGPLHALKFSLWFKDEHDLQ